MADVFMTISAPSTCVACRSIQVTVMLTGVDTKNIVFGSIQFPVRLSCPSGSTSATAYAQYGSQTVTLPVPCECANSTVTISASVGYRDLTTGETKTASAYAYSYASAPEIPKYLKCDPNKNTSATFLPPSPAVGREGASPPYIWYVKYHTCNYSPYYGDYVTYYVERKCRDSCTFSDIVRNSAVEVAYLGISQEYVLSGISCSPSGNCQNVNITPGGVVPTDGGVMEKPHIALFTLIDSATVSPVFSKRTPPPPPSPTIVPAPSPTPSIEWPLEWRENWAGTSVSPVYNITESTFEQILGRPMTPSERDSFRACTSTMLKRILDEVQLTNPGNLAYLATKPSDYILSVELTDWFKADKSDIAGIAAYCGKPLLTLSADSPKISPGTTLRLRGVVYWSFRSYPAPQLDWGKIDFQFQPGGVVEGLFSHRISAKIRVRMTGAPTPTPTPTPTMTPTPTIVAPTPWVPPPAWPTPTITPAPTPTITPTPTPAMTPTPPPTPLNIWLALAILGASGVGGYFIMREVSRRRKR